MTETKTGNVEAVSMKNFGIKIDGQWYNARDDKMKEELKKINKLDTVEYSFHADGRDSVLDSLLEKGGVGYPKAQGQYQKKPWTPRPRLSDQEYTEKMTITVSEVNTMMKIITDPEIKKSMNWAAVIDTLFMAKAGLK